MEGSIVRLRQVQKELPDVSLALAAREAIRPTPSFREKAKEVVPLLRDKAKKLAPVVRDRAKDVMNLVNKVKPFFIATAFGVLESVALMDLSTFNNGRLSGKTLISMIPIVFGSSVMTYKFSKKQQFKAIQNQNNLERLRSEPIPRETQYALAVRGSFEQKVALLVNPATSAKTINMIRKHVRFNEDLWKAFTAATEAVKYYGAKHAADQSNPFFEKQLRRSRTDLGFYDEAMMVLESRSNGPTLGPSGDITPIPIRYVA